MRVLAKMPFVDEKSMYRLGIPSSTHLARQRGCKELDRLQTQITAIKNRLRDTGRFAWPGLESIFKDIYGPMPRLFRETWYDPAGVVAAGAEEVGRTFEDCSNSEDDLHWMDYLVKLAAFRSKGIARSPSEATAHLHQAGIWRSLASKRPKVTLSR